MNLGVVYLLTNRLLAARLVVSLWSLRKWYDGPVTVFTTREESHEIGKLLVADKRLRIDHRTTSEVVAHADSTAAYLTKVRFLGESPYQATVFLDADTLIVGCLDELLDSALTSPITATIYGAAETDNGRTNLNLTPWKSLLDSNQRWRSAAKLLDQALRRPLPLVNAGVFAIQHNRRLLRAWQELAWIGRGTPTPEECALQLLLITQPHQLLGFHFNCLPYFAKDAHDVRIWHFAASSHLRIAQGRHLWLPAYRECARRKVAQIQTWSRVEEHSNATHNGQKPGAPRGRVRSSTT